MTLWRDDRVVESPNRKILRAALIIVFFTLLVKVGATAKELVVAHSFGRSDPLDAFLIATLLPSFVVVAGAGALSLALIPVFISTRSERGLKGAQELFSSVMFVTVVILILIAVLLGLLAPYYLPYLGWNFSAEKLLLARRLLYLLLPSTVFGGIAVCVSGVLNAGERFAVPALVPVVTPLVTTILLVAGGRNVVLLAAGPMAGSFIEATLLVWALRTQGLRFSLRWHGLDPAARAVLQRYAPLLIGAFCTAGIDVVDQSMAATLAPGSVAALSYAGKVISAVLAVGASALGTAALPFLSKMVAENDWAGCRHTLRRYSVLVFATTVPFTLGLMTLSGPVVRLLFERGSFTSMDADLVGWLQTCLAAQIPFAVCAVLFGRFLISANCNRVILWMSAIKLILDIVLNLALMHVWQVTGIAVATSLLAAIAFAAMAVYSVRFLQRRDVARERKFLGPQNIDVAIQSDATTSQTNAKSD